MFAPATIIQGQTLSSSSAGVSSMSSSSAMSMSSSSGVSSSSAGSTSGSMSSTGGSTSGSMSSTGGSSSGGASSTSGSSSTQTFCSKYTTALFGSDTAANEVSLLTAVVTRAVLGNTTVTPAVQGIVGAGSPIVQYFNGSIAYYRATPGATPVGGRNFLTNTALFNSLAAHLVQWFGSAFGCTGTGAYAGVVNQTYVHELMYVNNASMTYFDTQLYNTLSSFGVTDAAGDLTFAARYLYSFQRGGRSDYVICSASDCSTAQQLNALVLPTSSSSGGVSASGSSTGSSAGGSSSTGTSSAQNIVPALSAFAAVVVSVLAMVL